MASYRVLVVDDSAFMRKIFSDLIAADPQFEIAATATNGQEAIEAAKQVRPDVITLDLEMPEMNGLEALEHIMRKYPTPIIMMSSTSDDGTRETIKALQYGAFDFIRKPSGPNSPDIYRVGELLLDKLHAAVQARKPVSATDKRSSSALHTYLRPLQMIKQRELPVSSLKHEAALAPEQEKTSKLPKSTKRLGSLVHKPEEFEQPVHAEEKAPAIKSTPTANFKNIIVIGTSTGGPRALHEVISGLPGNLAAPVLVVQHMPPKFTHSLAQRLDSFSELHVTEAVQGERVLAGKVYIAPGGYHMKLSRDVQGYRIELTQEKPCSGHRPSVDVLFESCVPYPELHRHAVIMTGMGSDGVKGMKALMESGGKSAIAEAEESCVVYGMPRSAVEAGITTSIQPLKQIAQSLVTAVSHVTGS